MIMTSRDIIPGCHNHASRHDKKIQHAHTSERCRYIIVCMNDCPHKGHGKKGPIHGCHSRQGCMFPWDMSSSNTQHAACTHTSERCRHT